MTSFDNWIQKNGLKQVQVAARLAMEPGRLSRILNGDQEPTMFQVALIEELTCGAVNYHYWLERAKRKAKHKNVKKPV